MWPVSEYAPPPPRWVGSSVSVVVVLGDERLYSEVARDMAAAKPSVVVVKLAKSGGVRCRRRNGSASRKPGC